MANLFKSPKTKAVSNLAPGQESLLGDLSSFYSGALRESPSWIDSLIDDLMRSTGEEARSMSDRMFREALLEPALTAYDRDIVPQIAGDFARYGSTISSRRGQTIAEGRRNIVTNAQTQLASILPQVASFPLQQTLDQITGMGQLQNFRFLPAQLASAFAGQPTRQVVETPAGPGWGLLGSALQVGGFALGNRSTSIPQATPQSIPQYTPPRYGVR